MWKWLYVAVVLIIVMGVAVQLIVQEGLIDQDSYNILSHLLLCNGCKPPLPPLPARVNKHCNYFCFKWLRKNVRNDKTGSVF